MDQSNDFDYLTISSASLLWQWNAERKIEADFLLNFRCWFVANINFHSWTRFFLLFHQHLKFSRLEMRKPFDYPCQFSLEHTFTYTLIELRFCCSFLSFDKGSPKLFFRVFSNFCFAPFKMRENQIIKIYNTTWDYCAFSWHFQTYTCSVNGLLVCRSLCTFYLLFIECYLLQRMT